MIFQSLKTHWKTYKFCKMLKALSYYIQGILIFFILCVIKKLDNYCFLLDIYFKFITVM